jgi:predicted Zn finger-like uncharacterized protein
MKIVCESCGAKYSIADEKVAGKVFKIRCKKCSAVIVVKGDQQAEGAETAGAFDYGSDAIWHVVVSGEQQGPFAPRQIGELLAEGKIDWEAYVWREGMEGWQPAKDVEALVKSVMAEAEGSEPATTAQPSRLGGDVFGGSSDMGADPFASSDDGGLSGVIGQSVASATAAGGGADLFADSSRSAFAAAADDDDDDHGAAASRGGPKVSGDQALTGQRNENSVLFSLSNLQALATGSGSAPASARPKAGMAQGEGSGLIDIRALASATQAVADRPQYANTRDKVEDLLAVGSTGTTFSATSLAAPVAIDKPDHGRTMLYAMAAAILLLGGVVTYLVVKPSAPQPIAQIAPADDGNGDEENLTVPAARAPKEEPTEAPQAAEPTPPAEEPSEPAKEEGDKTAEASKEDGDKSERSSSRRERRHAGDSDKSAEKTEKAEKPEPVAAAEPAAAKKPAANSGDKSLDDLLDTALGGGKPAKAAKPAPAASESLPATPSRDDVLGAMKGIASDVAACGKGESGVAMAKVGVTGASGKVSSVDVGGQFAGTPVGSCIAKEVRKAKFPKFSQSTFSFSYPFKI